MKNIHVLSTNKPSRLSDCHDDRLHLDDVRYLRNYKNIYITSDEEIKEGDVVKIPCGVGKVKELTWKFGNDNPSYIIEDIFIYKLRYGQKEGELQINSFRYEDVKKIILTTDDQLIKDGVQSIPDEFLEWFVKNPSCESVEVKSLLSNNGNVFFGYKIIIPKEEPKQFKCRGMLHYSGKIIGGEHKQETLEEAAERLYPGVDRQVDRMLFINGAKWQQERSYSEEEVLKIIDLLFHKYASSFRVDAKEDFLLSKKK